MSDGVGWVGWVEGRGIFCAGIFLSGYILSWYIVSGHECMTVIIAAQAADMTDYTHVLANHNQTK